MNVGIIDVTAHGPVDMLRGMSLRIREIRKSQGLSQQELADRCGMSRSQLSEIESEVKPANTRRLNALAAALGVPVADLFSHDAKEAYLGEIEGLMAHMSEQDRQTLLRMARALAQAQEPGA